jgi:hypothetical protein
VKLPLLEREPFSLTYRFREITPVLKRGSQTQLLFSRYQLEAGLTLNDGLRLITVGGYRTTSLEDRPGSFSAYEVGLGLGSPIRSELPRLEWSVLLGGYLSPERLSSDWWADLHANWRLFQFEERQFLDTVFQPTLGLAVDIESSNEGGHFRAMYRIGPVLELMSGNGNRARLQARYYANDGNPFFENRYSGLLIGMEVNASLDQDVLFDARSQRRLGWLPMVWGQSDVGAGNDRAIQRTELDAEIHDFSIAGRAITAVLWYESRQEYRPGDFDNASYSISFGVQTRLALESILSQGQPLVVGLDYLHRSAHALAPNADRVPPPGVLSHDSLNLAPRFRLQTLGWDLPYRDPEIYAATSKWLNNFDWRLTIGWDWYHSRDRSGPSAQVGINWDIASLQGCVVYVRGIGSLGNETPDWLGELGVRRKKGKLFFRCERYGLENTLARGDSAVLGVGFNL